ncbi:MAG: hypothetical protein CL663_07515 [Bacteroidetes bacterium]|nr:hypothetical protein [Bacteroidota bacterium]
MKTLIITCLLIFSIFITSIKVYTQSSLVQEQHDGVLIINEVMFDPLTSSAEYIEIYNLGDTAIKISDITFVRIKVDFPNPPDTLIKPITDENFLVEPRTYYVLTKYPAKLLRNHPSIIPEQIIYFHRMPSLLNSGGYLGFKLNDQWLDMIYYSPKLHHQSLNYTDGVSLEKIHPELSGLEPQNWHSAAEDIGFASPTLQNSCYTTSQDPNSEISFSTKSISPNNDGFEDLLMISYVLPENGFTLNMKVFDIDGRFVSHPFNNTNCGIKGSVIWDAVDMNNEILERGLYIVLIEFFSEGGESIRHKKAISIIRD